MEGKEKVIVFDKVETDLKKVWFNKLETTSDKYEINVKNRFRFVSCNENGFIFRAERKISFIPSGEFEAIVEFEVSCVFDEESKKFYNGNSQEIKAFFNKRKYNIYNDLEIGNLSSILLSQITLINNFRAIITPPYIFD